MRGQVAVPTLARRAVWQDLRVLLQIQTRAQAVGQGGLASEKLETTLPVLAARRLVMKA